jgi:hypothetical protein
MTQYDSMAPRSEAVRLSDDSTLREFSDIIGLPTDTESAAGDGSLIALIKRLRTLLGTVGSQPSGTIQGVTANGIAPAGDPVLVSGWDGTLSRTVKTTTAGVLEIHLTDGADVTLGAKADTAYTTGAGSVVALLKGIFGRLLPAGQAAMAASAPVVIASNQSTLPVIQAHIPTATVAIAAGTATPTAVKAAAGTLGRVLITTAGAAAVVIYDHASAASGTILGTIAANAAAGTCVEFAMPAAAGIVVAGHASLPALTVSYA